MAKAKNARANARSLNDVSAGSDATFRPSKMGNQQSTAFEKGSSDPPDGITRSVSPGRLHSEDARRQDRDITPPPESILPSVEDGRQQPAAATHGGRSKSPGFPSPMSTPESGSSREDNTSNIQPSGRRDRPHAGTDTPSSNEHQQQKSYRKTGSRPQLPSAVKRRIQSTESYNPQYRLRLRIF
jgi:hypothetical protein